MRRRPAVAVLEVTARSVAARTGGVFLSHGEGAFDLLSAIGLDEEAQEAAVGEPSRPGAVPAGRERGPLIVGRSEAEASEAFAEWRAEALAADPGAAVEPTLELYMPLVLEDRTPGVLVLGPPPGRTRLRPRGPLFLEHVARQGALALDRAILFESEPGPAEDLDALLRVSRELASTLDLDHVMITAVNLTGAIAPRERAMLALFEGGS